MPGSGWTKNIHFWNFLYGRELKQMITKNEKKIAQKIVTQNRKKIEIRNDTRNSSFNAQFSSSVNTKRFFIN